MQYLGMLLVAVMLLAGPADGKETAKKKKAAKRPAAAAVASVPQAKSLCLDLAPPATGIYRLLPADTETARLLLVQPQLAPKARPEAPSPLRLDTDEDQVALAFPNSTVFTPWLGAAALNQEEAGEQLSFRLSAGLGCELDRSTRLSFGYHFAAEKSEIGDPLGEQPPDGAEETGHHFSLGLKKSF